jgi:hypothetical protein
MNRPQAMGSTERSVTWSPSWKPVSLSRSTIGRAEDVDLDLVRLEELVAAQHLGVRRSPLLVLAEGVVGLGGAVDAHADEEVVLAEELAPLVGEQRGVRLDGVLHHLAGAAVLLDECQGPTEEADPHQRRLAALPCDGDLGPAVGVEELADVRLEHVIAHAEAVAGIQRLLREEEAVLAVEVADGPRRLGQDVEGGRSRPRAAEVHRRLGHEKTVAKSSFMLTTVQPRRSASVSATSAPFV